jgi:broad specificity phosphatase PhoE
MDSLPLPAEVSLQTPTRLTLVRHAEVEAAYQGVFGGRVDMNLSPRGHEQASVLARYLGRQRVDAVYASPMRRVQQTLAPFGWTSQTMNELREVDFGDWTGLKWGQVQERFGVSAFDWLAQLEHAAIPNAESGAAFRARVQPSVENILREQRGKHSVVFCHGGVIRMIFSILLGLPLPVTDVLEVEYASVSRIALLPHKTELELLNFTPWRDLPA